jgi:hypothetical protein
VTSYNPLATSLYNSVQAGIGGTLTASGNTANLGIGAVTDVLLSVMATGVTGTTPTLDVYFDMQDAAGNWIQVLHPTQVTAATPSPVTAQAGLHMGSTSAWVLTGTGRIRWTVGGTGNPSVTGVSICLHGR